MNVNQWPSVYSPKPCATQPRCSVESRCKWFLNLSQRLRYTVQYGVGVIEISGCYPPRECAWEWSLTSTSRFWYIGTSCVGWFRDLTLRQAPQIPADWFLAWSSLYNIAFSQDCVRAEQLGPGDLPPHARRICQYNDPHYVLISNPRMRMIHSRKNNVEVNPRSPGRCAAALWPRTLKRWVQMRSGL
jgi:hypothetical protein